MKESWVYTRDLDMNPHILGFQEPKRPTFLGLLIMESFFSFLKKVGLLPF